MDGRMTAKLKSGETMKLRGQDLSYERDARGFYSAYLSGPGLYTPFFESQKQALRVVTGLLQAHEASLPWETLGDEHKKLSYLNYELVVSRDPDCEPGDRYPYRYELFENGTSCDGDGSGARDFEGALDEARDWFFDQFLGDD